MSVLTQADVVKPAPMRAIHDLATEGKRLCNELESRFRSRTPELLQSAPLVDYVRAFDSVASVKGYRYLPSLVQRNCQQVKEKGGGEALAEYHRLVLAFLMSEAERRVQQLRLPQSVTTLVAEVYRRIINSVSTAHWRFFRHENDLFAKDLGLCRLKLLPCGAELIDVSSGVPRSLALVNVPQGLRFAAFFARCGGFTRWYEGHWDRRLINAFNAPEYDDLYRRIAELLELNRAIRGFISASWWLDPALEPISPELSFLRKVPTENGAGLFKVGVDEAATRDAIVWSVERRRLYDAGNYRPQVYLIAWPRRAMLSWARRNPK